ncbi:putative uracil phosphoribosyltransferase urg2 [Paramyrothecium foliicola]|nr:putative uracil phosphoribosyltransferase urg2 [Paramyrothecium foliicola]
MPSNVVTFSNEEFSSKLKSLRDLSLRPVEVRRLTRELTSIVAREAVTKPAADERVAVAVILRSGMQMQEPFVAELPEDTDAVIYHLGLFRDKLSLQPVEYYNKLPAKDPRIKHAYVLDPVLATGGTVTAAINILKDWGVERISVVTILSSQVGLEAAAAVWPENTRFITGAVDPEVDSKGHIKPGIGDIGDRLFGTV